jgi:hypothetical protein
MYTQWEIINFEDAWRWITHFLYVHDYELWLINERWSPLIWPNKKICVFTVTRPTLTFFIGNYSILIFASNPINFYTEFGFIDHFCCLINSNVLFIQPLAFCLNWEQRRSKNCVIRHKTASTNDGLTEISKMKYRIPEMATTISGFADSK